MAKYTEEKKAAVLARVSEIGVSEAAKEAGISVKTVSKWNKEAAVKEAATILDQAVEKKAEAKAAIAEAEVKAQVVIADAAAESKKAVKEARAEKKVATEIEAKKKKAKVSRKVKEKKETVKAVAKKKVRKKRVAKMELIFESNGGLQIKPEDVAEKVPKGCDAAYVKLEENKIYWVKGEETGAVDIW